MAMSLPLEVLEEIWSHLDFHNCQKICTQVSKSWFFGIRNSPKLSSELRIEISRRGLSDEDVISVLGKWTKLRILEIDENYYKVKSDILTKKIKKYEDLDKIICNDDPRHRNVIPQLHVPFGRLFYVEKIWINPKKVSSDEAPFKLEHIVCLRVSNIQLPHLLNPSWNGKIMEFGPMMTGLEELKIFANNYPPYFLPDNGFLVSGHDHIGHGRSTGQRVQVKSMDEYVLPLLGTIRLEGLKTLKICGFKDSNVTSLFEHLKKMTGLKKLTLQEFKLSSNTLLPNLNSLLGEMKNLQDVNIEMYGGYRQINEKKKKLAQAKKMTQMINKKIQGAKFYIVEKKYGFSIQKQ
jgi:hypothetical protein